MGERVPGARWVDAGGGVFAGIRKVPCCAANPERSGVPEVTTVHDGIEATYSSFTLASARDLRKLVSGRAVELVYER